MSTNQFDYNQLLSRKLRAGLVALANGSFDDVKRQRLDQSLLDQHLGDKLSCETSEFLEACDAFLESAEGESDTDQGCRETDRMECQLQLIRLFVSIEEYDENSALSALRDFLVQACMWVKKDERLAAALFEFAYVANANDRTAIARICWTAIQWYFERANKQIARQWLQRFPVFEDRELNWVRDAWGRRLAEDLGIAEE